MNPEGLVLGVLRDSGWSVGVRVSIGDFQLLGLRFQGLGFRV